MQDYLRSSTSMLLIHEIIKQPVWGNMVIKVQELRHDYYFGHYPLSWVFSSSGTNLDIWLQKQLSLQTLCLKNSRRCTTTKTIVVFIVTHHHQIKQHKNF